MFYDHPKDMSNEEIYNIELFSQKQAREYIKEKLNIGDTYYYQCVLPEIKHKFSPIIKNKKTGKWTNVRITKKVLDDYILLKKRKFQFGNSYP